MEHFDTLTDNSNCSKFAYYMYICYSTLLKNVPIKFFRLSYCAHDMFDSLIHIKHKHNTKQYWLSIEHQHQTRATRSTAFRCAGTAPAGLATTRPMFGYTYQDRSRNKMSKQHLAGVTCVVTVEVWTSASYWSKYMHATSLIMWPQWPMIAWNWCIHVVTPYNMVEEVWCSEWRSHLAQASYPKSSPSCMWPWCM